MDAYVPQCAQVGGLTGPIAKGEVNKKAQFLPELRFLFSDAG